MKVAGIIVLVVVAIVLMLRCAGVDSGITTHEGRRGYWVRSADGVRVFIDKDGPYEAER